MTHITNARTLTMNRILAVAAAAAVLLALAAPAALAQSYPPQPGNVENPNVVVSTPGGLIAIQGSDFGPGATVCIVNRFGTVIGSGCEEGAETASVGAADAGDRPFAVATADENGDFVVEVAVADTAAPGDVALAAVGADEAGDVQVREIALQVAAAQSGAAGVAGAANAAVSGGAAAAPVAADAAAASPTVIAQAINADPAVSVLTVGNSLLVGLMVVAGLVLLVAGPRRRRRMADAA
jgi:hypothetical protein